MTNLRNEQQVDMTYSGQATAGQQGKYETRCRQDTNKKAWQTERGNMKTPTA